MIDKSLSNSEMQCCRLKQRGVMYYLLTNVRSLYSCVLGIILRLTAWLRWPFLKTAEIYGSEVCSFSPALVGHRKMIAIEDGFTNYMDKKEKRKWVWLRRVLLGPLAGNLLLSGRNPEFLSKVVLTGLCKSGYPTNIPIEFINIQKLWDKSSEEKKNLILKIYNIDDNDLRELKQRDEILITQTLSEDQIITEEEKIVFYRQLLQNCDPLKVMIKPHPREMTDYTKFFPEMYVFTKKVPMQLLSVLGIKFKKAYTVCSTAAYSLGNETEVIFLGSECHPNIVKRYGVVRFSKK